jgi:hypothetical protein
VAALSGVAPRALDVGRLRERLRAEGALFGGARAD